MNRYPVTLRSDTAEESGIHAIADLSPATVREPATVRTPSAWLVGADAYKALTASVAR